MRRMSLCCAIAAAAYSLTMDEVAILKPGTFEHQVNGRVVLDEWQLTPSSQRTGYFDCWTSSCFVDEALAWANHAETYAHPTLLVCTRSVPTPAAGPRGRQPARRAYALNADEAYRFFVEGQSDRRYCAAVRQFLDAATHAA
jgi:hypothetical protein